MAPLPSLTLARKIVRWYLNDQFKAIIVYGDLRIGKSTYALKVMGQVYEYLYDEPLSPSLIDNYMGWHPAEVIKSWKNIKRIARNKRKIPVYTWDDAGVWLFSLDWNDPLLRAIQRYMNLIGTDMACLIMTTPDPTFILSKIRRLPGLIRIEVKPSTSQNKEWPKNADRVAIAYQKRYLPDSQKFYMRKLWRDNFRAVLPDEIYKYYTPIRERYTEMAKEMMWEALIKKAEEDPKYGGIVKILNEKPPISMEAQI